VAVEAELLELVGVLGAHQPSLEVVDPRVVRALEAHDLANRRLDHRGAPVLADVVEAAQDGVAPAHDDQGLAGHRGEDVGAGLRGILRPPDAHPVLAEPLALLVVEDRRVVVRPAR